MTTPSANPDTAPQQHGDPHDSVGEFDLIQRHVRHHTPKAELGPGDDCALLRLSPGHSLATSTDMLVEGRHFFADVDPEALGHKALAVNLSDLAACGAKPLGFTLAVALPEVHHAWLTAFMRGLYALADDTGCELIGGDTTRGPLTLSITVLGEVPTGQALLRSGAQVGDELWVTGTLGDARLALECLRQARGEAQGLTMVGPALMHTRTALERPQPRLAWGTALRGWAHAVIDLSDGLMGDLNHILKASGVGASIQLDRLPRSPILRQQSTELQHLALLAGGDDYELLFAAPPSAAAHLTALAPVLGTPITRVGSVTREAGLKVLDAHGQPLSPEVLRALRSFDHFSPHDHA